MTLSSQENFDKEPICSSSLVHVFKSAGDSLRLDILRVLKRSSFGVQELAFIFDMAQPGMSHHLKVLSKAGLITSRREGNSLFYRRPLIHKNSPIRDLLQSVYDTIDQIQLKPEISARVQKVKQDRSEQSKEFFAKNASIFAEEQGRIVNFDQYKPSTEDLMSQFSKIDNGLALELGPGDGELLKFLASKFVNVIAVDNSKDMLQRTEGAIKRAGIDNVTFIHGEIDEVINKEIKVDLLALNMVLHHMASPQESFSQFVKALKPGGVLFIAELCDHNQDWVRESCGDLWLGFRPGEIDEWAAACGLEVGHSLYIGMKNGFQVQLKAFFNKQGGISSGNHSIKT